MNTSAESLPNLDEDGEFSEPPILRVRNALQEIEERRTAKLQHMKVIGSETNKKEDLVRDLVQVNYRRVNFKWQLGNKIGQIFYCCIFSYRY